MTPHQPLKIVHVAATGTGAPWMVALLREQKQLGHTVAAIVPTRDAGIGAQLEALDIPCYAAEVDILFARPRLAGKLAVLIRLVRLLRQIRPHVVHSHIINSVVTMRLAAWLADVPMHIGANSHPISMESEVLRPIEVGTSFCDAVTIASCSYTYDLMLRYGVPKDRLELIYYAVDQSRHDPSLANGRRVRDELGLTPGTPVIGNIAYFYPPARSPGIVPPRLEGRGVKGHDVLIRAVPGVLERHPDAKCILVGRGWGPAGADYEAALKSLANSLGVAHAVLFVGEREDIPDLLAAFDISVQCSLSDNLAGTVESLLMARPLVVSDIAGFADTVLHEKTGLVVAVDDPAALAAALVRLLDDRVLAQRLAVEGRRHALSRFTLARTVADLERLLAARPPAAGRYRLGVTAVRAVALPIRLLPVFSAVHTALKQHGWTVRRFAVRRLRRTASRCVALVRKPRITASGSA